MIRFAGGTVAALAAGPVLADSYDGYGHMWGGGMMGWLIMVAFWALVIVLAVMAARAMSARNGNSGSALDILRERYARGEIDEDDFDRRRAVLEAKRD